MTEWVVLIPAGDTGRVYEADVSKPVVAPISDAERMIRRLALERELAELQAEEGGALWDPAPQPGTLSAPPFTAVAAVASEVPATVPVAAVDAEVPEGEVVARVGADGITRWERNFSARVPGPQYVCFCEQCFTDQRLYLAHIKTCGRYSGAVRVGGAQHEPGSFKWGHLPAQQ
jgi:hypothetical protein